ncbi:hypothetical protein HYDPIDRAFT_35872 [Hydnomerulius pinastri MD-312]|nr:hypothetical protein HYDPIDRAFT_35872 [Hydnomerulius pinastri MD-312]
MECNTDVQVTQTDIDRDVPMLSSGTDLEHGLDEIKGAQIMPPILSESLNTRASSVGPSLCLMTGGDHPTNQATDGQDSLSSLPACVSAPSATHAVKFLSPRAASLVQTIEQQRHTDTAVVEDEAHLGNSPKVNDEVLINGQNSHVTTSVTDAHVQATTDDHCAAVQRDGDPENPYHSPNSPLPSTVFEVFDVPKTHSRKSTGPKEVPTPQRLLDDIDVDQSGLESASPEVQEHSELVTQMNFGSPNDDFPSSSLPPSSSPPQVFSSSPFASSQSSLAHFNGECDGKQKDVIQEDEPILQVSSTVEDETSNSPELGDEPVYASEDLLDHVMFGIEEPCNDDGAGVPRSMAQSLGKRSFVEDNDLADTETDGTSSPPSKRMKTSAEVYRPPAPKRATLASQQRQYKKLIAPFRSPMRSPSTNVPSGAMGDNSTLTSQLAPLSELGESHPEPEQKQAIEQPSTSSTKIPTASRVRTLRAAAQFKSPIVASGPVSAGSKTTIRLTPTVQMLERKLQLLKRAVKVKENNEEQALSKVSKKWTEAGREVAYEVWDLVKDVGRTTEKATSLGGSWGWEGTDTRDTNWGWETPAPKTEDTCGQAEEYDALGTSMIKTRPDIEEEEEDRARDNLGTMLRHLGIAPDTLGWDDETETFID